MLECRFAVWPVRDVVLLGSPLHEHRPLRLAAFATQRELNLDGPIRANQFGDLRESADSRESYQGSRIAPPCSGD